MPMIFAESTEENCLYAFDAVAEAISYCEGVDVEDGIWRFWDGSGRPLLAHFHRPNERGRFTVRSGNYSLAAAYSKHRVSLSEILSRIGFFEGKPPFNTASGVMSHLLGNSVG